MSSLHARTQCRYECLINLEFLYPHLFMCMTLCVLYTVLQYSQGCRDDVLRIKTYEKIKSVLVRIIIISLCCTRIIIISLCCTRIIIISLCCTRIIIISLCCTRIIIISLCCTRIIIISLCWTRIIIISLCCTRIIIISLCCTRTAYNLWRWKEIILYTVHMFTILASLKHF